MKNKKSHILSEMHGVATDLHKLGFIDKRKMQKYDLFCSQEIPDYDSEKIRLLRHRLHISQAVLAAAMNISLSTVRQWEIGDKHPSGPSLKLLNLIDKKGFEAIIY